MQMCNEFLFKIHLAAAAMPDDYAWATRHFQLGLNVTICCGKGISHTTVAPAWTGLCPCGWRLDARRAFLVHATNSNSACAERNVPITCVVS